MGPVEKMALMVVAEGNKVSQRAAARACTLESLSQWKATEKEAQRPRLWPVSLAYPVQQYGGFALEEASSQGGPVVSEMDFLHGLKARGS